MHSLYLQKGKGRALYGKYGIYGEYKPTKLSAGQNWRQKQVQQDIRMKKKAAHFVSTWNKRQRNAQIKKLVKPALLTTAGATGLGVLSGVLSNILKKKKKNQKGGNWNAIQELRVPQPHDAVSNDYYPQWIDDDFVDLNNAGAVQEIDLPLAPEPHVLPPPLVDRPAIPIAIGLGALLSGIWLYNKYEKFRKWAKEYADNLEKNSNQRNEDKLEKEYKLKKKQTGGKSPQKVLGMSALRPKITQQRYQVFEYGPGYSGIRQLGPTRLKNDTTFDPKDFLPKQPKSNLKKTALTVGALSALGGLGGVLGGLLKKKKKKQRGGLSAWRHAKNLYQAGRLANKTLGVRGTYNVLTNKGIVSRTARAGVKHSLKSIGKKSLKYTVPAIVSGTTAGLIGHLLNKNKKRKKSDIQEGGVGKDFWELMNVPRVPVQGFDHTGKIHIPKDQMLPKIMPSGLAARSSLMGAAASRRARYNLNKKKMLKKWTPKMAIGLGTAGILSGVLSGVLKKNKKKKNKKEDDFFLMIQDK